MTRKNASGLHDPYADQLAAARYRAERDQAREELAKIKADRSWDARADAGMLGAKEDRRAVAWVREHGGLESVEARLMPEGYEWPRFEDGAQVKFGDVVSDGDETGRVYYVTFDTVNPVIIGFTDEEPDRDPGTYLEVSVNDGKLVKRPAPKALDADGVEIRVGDTVCGTRDMEPMRVVDTDSRECGLKRIKCEKEGDGFFFYCADELTHKLPVLAADGRPLREGETVWDVNGVGPLTVNQLTSDSDMHISLKKDGTFYYRWADKLTHERPDSWERLEEDADVAAGLFDAFDEDASAAIRNLVRRAKKLARCSAR